MCDRERSTSPAARPTAHAVDHDTEAMPLLFIIQRPGKPAMRLRVGFGAPDAIVQRLHAGQPIRPDAAGTYNIGATSRNRWAIWPEMNGADSISSVCG